MCAHGPGSGYLNPKVEKAMSPLSTSSSWLYRRSFFLENDIIINCTHVCACVHACMCACVRVCMCVCVEESEYMHVYMCMQVRMCVCAGA